MVYHDPIKPIYSCTLMDTKTLNIDTLVNEISVQQLIEMFDLLPDILFWIKDLKGHFIYANSSFLAHVGVSNVKQIIGCTDFDFAPTHIAKQFIIDDEKVIKGEIVNDRLEMNHDRTDTIAWFTTSKRPLFDASEMVIGSYGISRHLEKTSIALSGMIALKLPVDHVRQNYMNNISLEALADISHLSISALERRFKKHLKKTPKQFINEVRLENARKLLIESNIAISLIAEETGFTDHSYFSKQFKRLFGVIPSEFRKTHNK